MKNNICLWSTETLKIHFFLTKIGYKKSNNSPWHFNDLSAPPELKVGRVNNLLPTFWLISILVQFHGNRFYAIIIIHACICWISNSLKNCIYWEKLSGLYESFFLFVFYILHWNIMNFIPAISQRFRIIIQKVVQWNFRRFH